MDLLFKTPFTLIAHRGANLLAPENTLPAFALAYDMGAAWVECDAVLTADHVPVILHDRNLLRTAGQQVNIDELNYDDLQKYNVGAYFAKEHAHTTVPRLEDVLELALQYGRGVNVEIKPVLPEYAALTAECVCTVIEPYFSRIPVLVSSFEWDCLLWYKKHSPKVNLGYLMSDWEPDWKEKALELNAISLHCDETILTQKRIECLTDSIFAVLAYTVNKRTRAEELFKAGISGIFSDDPQLLSKGEAND